MNIELHEIFHDGDSFFFVQQDGGEIRSIGIWCWTEFDGQGESVSDIIGTALTCAYQAIGARVEWLRYDADDVLDDKHGGFDANQDEVLEALEAEMQADPGFLGTLPRADAPQTRQTLTFVPLEAK